MGIGRILGENKIIKKLQEILSPSSERPLGVLACMHSSFIIHKKEVYFFGSDDSCKRKGIYDKPAQAENGRTFYDRVTTPVLIELHGKIPLQIASSGDHTFILSNDNTLFRFGNHGYGELGLEPYKLINILAPLQTIIEKEQCQQRRTAGIGNVNIPKLS